ncbi:MAG: ABC transporter permease [Ruminiclostridium sp.]|nr:ABC transporter permease [Ruminiclostridium sp.]
MLKYEIKKYILKPSVILCLILFLLLNIGKYFELFYHFDGGRAIVSGYTALSEGESKLYEKYGGLITDEKIEMLKSELKTAEAKLKEYGIIEEPMEGFYTGYPYGDAELFKNTFIPAYEYAIFYFRYSNEISEAARQNAVYYAEFSDYEVRKNTLISSLYKNRRVDYCVKGNGWSAFFDYKFSSLLVIFLLIFILSPLFSSERAGGFDRLIISSGKRKAAIRSKLILALLLSFFLTIIFFFEDMLIIDAFSGLDCFNAPIYAVSEFQNCSFDITLFESCVVSAVSRFIVMLCFTSIICFLSTFGKNTAVSGLLSFSVGALFVLLSEVLPQSLDIAGLVYTSDLFRGFSVVNIFGFPVFSVVTAILLTLIIATLFIIATVRRAFR